MPEGSPYFEESHQHQMSALKFIVLMLGMSVSIVIFCLEVSSLI